MVPSTCPVTPQPEMPLEEYFDSVSASVFDVVAQQLICLLPLPAQEGIYNGGVLSPDLFCMCLIAVAHELKRVGQQGNVFVVRKQATVSTRFHNHFVELQVNFLLPLNTVGACRPINFIKIVLQLEKASESKIVHSLREGTAFQGSAHFVDLFHIIWRESDNASAAPVHTFYNAVLFKSEQRFSYRCAANTISPGQRFFNQPLALLQFAAHNHLKNPAVYIFFDGFRA